MRPDFIPSAVFRSWLSLCQLNALLVVDGILASSFIHRCAKQGRPVRHSCDSRRAKRYRPLDIVARASAMGLHVSMPQITKQHGPRDAWAALISERHEIADILLLSNQLTGRCLLTEAEIVSAAGYACPTSAVYFLIKKEKVVYVGQTRNLSHRIEQHQLSKDFERWAFIACDVSQLDVLESLYIHLLRPRLNGKRGETLIAPIALESLLKLSSRLPAPAQQS